jgi:hypothetical protein
MNKQNKNVKAEKSSLSLADRLCDEAKRSRPAFSESLHRNIAHAIAQRQSKRPIAAPPWVAVKRRHADLAASRHRWIAAAVAVCCAATILTTVGIHAKKLSSDAAKRQAILGVENPLANVPPPDVWTSAAWDKAATLIESASPLPPADRVRQDAIMLADTVLQRLPIDARENDVAAEAP